MKPLFPIVLLVATMAAAQQATPPPPSSATTQAPALNQDPSAEKARALLQQAIQALGGQAYLTYTDMEQQGRNYSFYHGEARGGGTRFWRFWKWPDKDRYELTLQRDVIDIYNGDKGYEITFKGVGNLEPEQLTDYLRRLPFSLEHILREWINKPGVAFFYGGMAVADAKSADKVTLINAQDQSVTLFLDSDTHLPIRKTFQWRDEFREINDESEAWDNYRSVQGIMTPFSTVRHHNGEIVNQRFLNSVTYNQHLPDSLFDPQAAAKILNKK